MNLMMMMMIIIIILVITVISYNTNNNNYNDNDSDIQGTLDFWKLLKSWFLKLGRCYISSWYFSRRKCFLPVICKGALLIKGLA